ncbi:MAG: polysaccharide pyruvyl transferase family protein [Coriobacteriaceae bacterium]|nr:polysaccharide pyruvyl transferase family protein [Coriobacteriaceae bacterium]
MSGTVNANGMSVAVVSLYARENYGNCLQRHAVHKLLEQLGCSPVSLDHRSMSRDYLREWASERLAPTFLGRMLPVCARARRFLAFDRECKRLKVRSDGLMDLNDKFGAFVVGSDQVWNPRIWDFEPGYNLLGFVEPSWRCIALSPSVGVSEIQESDKEAFSAHLARFSRLSVRETEGASIIERLLDRKVEVLPDPTLAFGASYWESVADCSLAPSRPYVLAYGLGKGSACADAAHSFARNRGYEVVELNNRNNEYYIAGPGDFIGLIFGAEAVFTDSFHASVFSLLGHVPFKVLCRQGSGYSMSSRIDTLGRTFGVDPGNLEQEYDWNGIDGCQVELSEKIITYLSDEVSRVLSEGSR